MCFYKFSSLDSMYMWNQLYSDAWNISLHIMVFNFICASRDDKILVPLRLDSLLLYVCIHINTHTHTYIHTYHIFLFFHLLMDTCVVSIFSSYCAKTMQEFTCLYRLYFLWIYNLVLRLLGYVVALLSFMFLWLNKTLTRITMYMS